MTTRWDEFPCVAASIDALVQQVAVQLLTRGYWWYVTGMVPEGVLPEHVDRAISEKYELNKCWRYRAEQKRKGFATIEYARHERFYIILATKGRHAFKVMERKRIRTVKKGGPSEGFSFAPIFIPIREAPPLGGQKKKKKKRSRSESFLEGYSVSYRKGRYLRKTAEEREEYQRAKEVWKRNLELGIRVAKPAKGVKDPKWRTHTEIEERSFARLEAYFLSNATHWPREKLEAEFRAMPYQPYWGVKQQLFSILCQVNDARKKAGIREKLPYRVVHGMKRDQIPVFIGGEEGPETEARAAEAA